MTAWVCGCNPPGFRAELIGMLDEAVAGGRD